MRFRPDHPVKLLLLAVDQNGVEFSVEGVFESGVIDKLSGTDRSGTAVGVGDSGLVAVDHSGHTGSLSEETELPIGSILGIRTFGDLFVTVGKQRQGTGVFHTVH